MIKKLVDVAEIEDTRGHWASRTRRSPPHKRAGNRAPLIEEIISEARRAGKEIPPRSYAEKMLAGKEKYRDVLVNAD